MALSATAVPGASLPQSGPAVRASYLVTDEEEFTKLLFAALVWLLMMFLIPYIWIRITGSIHWGVGIGFSSWLALVGLTIPFFVVNVPEVTGLIVVDPFKRAQPDDQFANMRVYLTGLHFKWPWEQVKEDLFLNLRIVTQSFTEDFPARGGARVHERGSIQYRPRPRLLPLYILVGDTTIKEGLVDVVTSYLSDQIRKVNAITARGKIREYEFGIREAFLAHKEAVVPTGASDDEYRELTLEDLYGIDILLARLGDTGYEERFQGVLTTQQVMARLEQSAKQLQDKRGLAPKDAMNAAMIINGNIVKQVFEAEGNAGDALAALVLNWGRGVGGGSPT